MGIPTAIGQSRRRWKPLLRPGNGYIPIAPVIIITDYSRIISPDEAQWREEFLQNALDSRIPSQRI
jgi:hypothetical protein